VEFDKPFQIRAIPLIPKGPRIIQDEIEDERGLNG